VIKSDAFLMKQAEAIVTQSENREPDREP
jgi:hypothetical protein